VQVEVAEHSRHLGSQGEQSESFSNDLYGHEHVGKIANLPLQDVQLSALFSQSAHLVLHDVAQFPVLRKPCGQLQVGALILVSLQAKQFEFVPVHFEH
jgi:hypothetical protein